MGNFRMGWWRMHTVGSASMTSRFTESRTGETGVYYGAFVGVRNGNFR